MRAAFLALALAAASPAAAAQYDWDAIGAEFCRLSTAGDVAGLRPLLSQALNSALDAALANPALMPPTVLFQSYTNPVATCRAKTRNAALVEIDRGNPPRGVPSWTEYLVIAPERDGSSRIDDVLFATRRSDTLRARLAYYALAR
jgi:hypothetical protein